MYIVNETDEFEALNFKAYSPNPICCNLFFHHIFQHNLELMYFF